MRDWLGSVKKWVAICGSHTMIPAKKELNNRGGAPRALFDDGVVMILTDTGC